MSPVDLSVCRTYSSTFRQPFLLLQWLFWLLSLFQRPVSAFQWSSPLVALLPATFFHIPVDLSTCCPSIRWFPPFSRSSCCSPLELWQVTPPPASSSTDLHNGGYGISIGLATLPHAPTLLCARLSQTVHFSSACRHVAHHLGLRFYCQSRPSCASITSEFCLKRSFLADTPLELGSVYLSLSIVWFAILGTIQSFFYMFWVVMKNFPVTNPAAISFLRVFWPLPLSCHSFSSEELSGRLFYRCPFPACFSLFAGYLWLFRLFSLNNFGSPRFVWSIQILVVGTSRGGYE